MNQRETLPLLLCPLSFSSWLALDLLLSSDGSQSSFSETIKTVTYCFPRCIKYLNHNYKTYVFPQTAAETLHECMDYNHVGTNWIYSSCRLTQWEHDYLFSRRCAPSSAWWQKKWWPLEGHRSDMSPGRPVMMNFLEFLCAYLSQNDLKMDKIPNLNNFKTHLTHVVVCDCQNRKCTDTVCVPVVFLSVLLLMVMFCVVSSVQPLIKQQMQ